MDFRGSVGRIESGPEKGKRARRLVGIVLGGGLLAATFLGFLGGLWWPLDLLSSFRFQYLVGLLLAVALLALSRSGKLALVVLAGAAVNLALLFPLYLGSPAPAASVSSALRILAFNVGVDNQRTEDVIAFFANSGADLIFIFEGGPQWEEAIRSSDLAYELSPGLPTAFGFGNAILVRSGLEVRLDGVRVGPNTPRARQLDMEFDGLPISILAVHPPSPTSGTKSATRDEQLAGVVDWADAQDRPVVVVGDLNASPWSRGFRPLAESSLINSVDGFGLQASWPSLLGPFGVPIDHVLHSPELTTVTRTTGPSLGSEHRAVSITLSRTAG
jgi:endonuclease/exonuclease/phosphatase (EEP) superfamily protein YafD